jgi:hypothetical protein
MRAAGARAQGAARRRRTIRPPERLSRAIRLRHRRCPRRDPPPKTAIAARSSMRAAASSVPVAPADQTRPAAAAPDASRALARAAAAGRVWSAGATGALDAAARIALRAAIAVFGGGSRRGQRRCRGRIARESRSGGRIVRRRRAAPCARAPAARIQCARSGGRWLVARPHAPSRATGTQRSASPLAGLEADCKSRAPRRTLPA